MSFSDWICSELVGTGRNMVGLGSSGTNWKWLSNQNPVGKKRGSSLLIWQVPYLEISDRNPIGIQSVPTGSDWNLWGSDKTSKRWRLWCVLRTSAGKESRASAFVDM